MLATWPGSAVKKSKRSNITEDLNVQQLRCEKHQIVQNKQFSYHNQISCEDLALSLLVNESLRNFAVQTDGLFFHYSISNRP
jgi:hypothetical protein